MTKKLSLLDRHPALFLLTNCFSIPKLVYFLRSAPCYLEQDILDSFDSSIRSCAELICNVIFDNSGWQQAKLPVRFGGLGLRSCSDISLPAYLSSLASSRSLIQSVLPNNIEQDCIDRFDSAVDAWTQADFSSPPESAFSIQKEWDNCQCLKLVESLKISLDQHRLACLISAMAPHSGAWLNSLPCSSFGTLLDNESLRIGVAIRLGLRVCSSHKCRCGALVDEFGLHPLSCRLSAGRFPRHSALNDIIKRGLGAAGFPSQLEPVGLIEVMVSAQTALLFFLLSPVSLLFGMLLAPALSLLVTLCPQLSLLALRLLLLKFLR